MDISQFASMQDVTRSATAQLYRLDNTPNETQVENLKRTCTKLYDPLCEHFGGRLYISSGFRSKAVNSRVGGSSSSSHTKGEALDIDGAGNGTSTYLKVSNIDLFNYIRENLSFDQLIAEFEQNGEPAWVHASCADINRGQVLIAVKTRLHQTVYYPYSPKLFRALYNKAPRVKNDALVFDPLDLPVPDQVTQEAEVLTGDYMDEYEGNKVVSGRPVSVPVEEVIPKPAPFIEDVPQKTHTFDVDGLEITVIIRPSLKHGK